MTITVIGHLCIDQHSRSGELEEQWGGILYSLLTLVHLMDEGDTIRPVFSVGKADSEKLMDLLKHYPSIDTRGIAITEEPTNRVMLIYHEDGESRTECSRQIAAPIPWARIKPALDADGILINMVSGFDITLETLDRIRMETREREIPIHLDLHSLTLGVDQHAKRFRRPVPEWRRWCFGIHTVQMSEEEAAGLPSERYPEPELVHQLMSLMVNNLLITRGSRGVTLVTQTNKKLSRHDVPGDNVGAVIDPTGCGDVFGAAWQYWYLKTHDPLEAAKRANHAAALNATVRGPEALTLLRRHRSMEVQQ
jgi:sugar/nucleoside kinase (ribokinase family)